MNDKLKETLLRPIFIGNPITTLILGICFGTYASLFIGTPVMFDATAWNNRRKAAKKK